MATGLALCGVGYNTEELGLKKHNLQGFKKDRKKEIDEEEYVEAKEEKNRKKEVDKDNKEGVHVKRAKVQISSNSIKISEKTSSGRKVFKV